MIAAEHVGSGTFRVDRAKALAVLGRFQLADPLAFLLPWLRLAAGSEASRVEINVTRAGLELAFDGRPLSPACLADPWACLLRGEEERLDGRYAHLLAGILAALRLGPKRLSIASGAERRLRLTIESREREFLQPEPAGRGTRLSVVWRGWFTRGRSRECLKRLAPACGLFPVPVVVEGRVLAGVSEVEFPIELKEPGFRGRMALAEPAARESRLWLYTRGVLAAEVTEPSDCPFRAHVNCDELTLDASHSGIRRDGAYQLLLGALTAQARTAAN